MLNIHQNHIENENLTDFFLVCLHFSVNAQTTHTLGDIAYANRLLSQSREAFSRRQFDSALLKMDNAQVIFEQVLGKEMEKKKDSNLSIKREDSIAFAERVLSICLKNIKNYSHLY